jgi:hypothetical protein
MVLLTITTLVLQLATTASKLGLHAQPRFLKQAGVQHTAEVSNLNNCLPPIKSNLSSPSPPIKSNLNNRSPPIMSNLNNHLPPTSLRSCPILSPSFPSSATATTSLLH